MKTMNSVQEMKEAGLTHQEIYRRAIQSVSEESRRNFFNFRRRQECAREALMKPLPGPSEDAFVGGSLSLAGRTIHEVVPTHILCLQALDSPILKMGKEASESSSKTSNADWTEEQQWELCYVFTQPPRILRMLLKEKGAEVLRSEAEKCWEGKPAALVTMICMAAFNQYARHHQTTVKFAAELEGQGEAHFFREMLKSQPKDSAG